MPKQRAILVILDGWGIGPDYPGNAIRNAKTPTMDSIASTFPHAELVASGESVGLPKGEDGNTETGHLNLGAGRIVYQDLPRINMAIASGAFGQNKAFLELIEQVKANKSKLHLLGLIGQGGVHSSNEHLYALMRVAKEQKVEQCYLHLITDGRDSPPTSSPTYVQQVQSQIQSIGIGQIATIVGRYYAMDRDKRYERTAVAYEAMVAGTGEETADVLTAIAVRHGQGESDEFIKPLIVAGAPRIESGDGVIFFNYRIDRPRQLTRAFVLSDAAFAKHHSSFDPYLVKYQKTHLTAGAEVSQVTIKRSKVLDNLRFVTMTEYEKDLPVEIAFPPEFVEMPLSRVLALEGRRQLKLAESEKERFVTYYFNGQRELPFPGEDIKITPSPKVATYDLKPEMSGREQTTKLTEAIQSGLYDLIVINYANPDMVAHTGVYDAAIRACEYVDSWMQEVYLAVMSDPSIVMFITADHGNAEELVNLETANVDTEHSSFPVPLYIVGRQFLGKGRALRRGILADVAPTILKVLGLSQPSSMTGRSLL